MADCGGWGVEVAEKRPFPLKHNKMQAHPYQSEYV